MGCLIEAVASGEQQVMLALTAANHGDAYALRNGVPHFRQADLMTISEVRRPVV